MIALVQQRKLSTVKNRNKYKMGIYNARNPIPNAVIAVICHYGIISKMFGSKVRTQSAKTIATELEIAVGTVTRIWREHSI